MSVEFPILCFSPCFPSGFGYFEASYIKKTKIISRYCCQHYLVGQYLLFKEMPVSSGGLLKVFDEYKNEID